MNAYASSYVPGAQRRLGAMFDYAVHGCGQTIDMYYQQFLASPLSVRFEAGDPYVVAGRSGEELALDVLGSVADGMHDATDVQRTGASGKHRPAKPPSTSPLGWRPHSKASREYWTGWALAFYQWASGGSFTAIENAVPIKHIRSMYRPYHEMDIRQFCDAIDARMTESSAHTNLQATRLAAGLSQSQLSAMSGVPVRTLQQYEQGQKDINHARADYVAALSRILCCDYDTLLEHRAGPTYEYAVVEVG